MDRWPLCYKLHIFVPVLRLYNLCYIQSVFYRYKIFYCYLNMYNQFILGKFIIMFLRIHVSILNQTFVSKIFSWPLPTVPCSCRLIGYGYRWRTSDPFHRLLTDQGLLKIKKNTPEEHVEKIENLYLGDLEQNKLQITQTDTNFYTNSVGNEAPASLNTKTRKLLYITRYWTTCKTGVKNER